MYYPNPQDAPGLRISPKAPPMAPQVRERARAEFDGLKALLDPALAKLGIRLAVEDHPASRLFARDKKGRTPTSCPPNGDWLVLAFEDAVPGSGAVEAAAGVLRASGAAEFTHRGHELWHYEQHILECCVFVQHLTGRLAAQAGG